MSEASSSTLFLYDSVGLLLVKHQIELSDQTYQRFIKYKFDEESWDDFFRRLLEVIRVIPPSNKEWHKSIKKTFDEHELTFQRLAE